MPKSLDLEILKNIVKEELELYCEALDHESIREIVDTASRLLEQMDKFQDKATTPMLNAVGEEFRKLRASLEYIVKNPESYVDREKKIVITKKHPSHRLKSKGIKPGRSVGEPKIKKPERNILDSKVNK